MKLAVVLPAFLMGITALANPAPAPNNEVSGANLFSRQDSHAFCAAAKCSKTQRCPGNCASCDYAKGTCIGLGSPSTCEPSACGENGDCADTCAGCCGKTGKCVKNRKDCPGEPKQEAI
ncbi:hypothetical protein CERZMDRAFT_82871 [Cercospora zeae-maydis SCOH1-5]|uniref:Uncharacterized protein n=1 Tax=Cercospora zeae-maydis SCOH1-5 TaxID=717836 RepID=A0A6A6FNF1_9PEZI|nr:hypothetical protein CERZMDRAFT_82871 [Cercospora zeae-maydis SCOH1-5]